MATEKSKSTTLNDATFVASTKRTQLSLRAILRQRQTYRPWTPERIAVLHRHPDMTAAELAAHMGATPAAIRCARSRYGRYSKGTERLCIACDARPVFVESPQANRWHLCKSCYLDELSRRAAECQESDRVRQRVHRA